ALAAGGLVLQCVRRAGSGRRLPVRGAPGERREADGRHAARRGGLGPRGARAAGGGNGGPSTPRRRHGPRGPGPRTDPDPGRRGRGVPCGGGRGREPLPDHDGPAHAVDLLQSHLRAPVTTTVGTPVARLDHAADPTAVTRWLWLFLAAVTVLRVGYLVSGRLDLSPDEAHYWEWSRRLDLAYYSKGPLVAYVIRGLTAVLGTSPLAIRLGAVLLSLAGSLAIYRLGRLAFGDPRTGLLAVVGLQLTPLFWAGSLLMTIDPPFLVLWVLALLGLHRALIGGEPRAWVWAGVAVGVGFLAK